MKNRKYVVVAFMLIAVMLLSVGYAAVTNVLDIQGSVSVSGSASEEEFNEDIYFTGVVVDGVLKAEGVVAGDNKGYTANINSNNNDKAQFTVTSISKTGNSQTITFQIKNDSAHEVAVSLKTLTNTNDSSNGGEFGFTYYFGTEDVQETTIAAGGTVDVTVKVSLDEQLTGASSSSFVVELNVKAGQ